MSSKTKPEIHTFLSSSDRDPELPERSREDELDDPDEEPDDLDEELDDLDEEPDPLLLEDEPPE